MSLTDQVLQAMTEAETRVPQSLQALKNHYDVTNEQIAQAMGRHAPMTTGRNWVQARIHGTTRCSTADLAGFAVAFGVPISVFYEKPATVIQWVLDHPDDRPGWLARPLWTWMGVNAA